MSDSKTKILSDLLSNYESSQIDSGLISIGFGDRENRDEVKKRLDKDNIESTKEGSSKLRIELKSISSDVYYDENSFITEYNFLTATTTDFADKDIIIVKPRDNSYLRYSNNEVFDKEDKKIECLLFENLDAVNNIFISISNSTDSLIQYHDNIQQKFILSTADNNYFEIGYKLPKLDFLLSSEFDIRRNKLKEILNRQDYIPHFKRALIERTIHQPVNERFKTLILYLEEINNKAKYYFELYLRKFSFDKLVDDLRKAKEKYFSDTREIIDKLLNKIVAIPISVSATLFALFKVREDLLYSVLVGLSFLVYAIFTYYLVNLINEEVHDIQEQFESDSIRIEEESGLRESEVKPFKRTIQSRINSLKTSTIFIKIILFSTACTVTYLLFHNRIQYDDVLGVLSIIVFTVGFIRITLSREGSRSN